MDRDCQRWHVTGDLARGLGLKVHRKENVDTKFVGRNDESEVSRLNVVSFMMTYRSQRAIVKCVEASYIPTLYSPLNNQCISEPMRFIHLLSSNLVNDFFKGFAF